MTLVPGRAALAAATRGRSPLPDGAFSLGVASGELVPAAWHHVEQYENNRIEADHSRLKNTGYGPCEGGARPHRGGHHRPTRVPAENLHRGHDEVAAETVHPLQIAAAFTELAQAMSFPR